MKNRFLIAKAYICSFFSSTDGTVFANIDSPRKLCVIDLKQKISIDIETKLQYDYLETINNKYFINNSKSKIKSYKKVVAFPIRPLSLNADEVNETYNIIKSLENKETFLNGNLSLNKEKNKKNINYKCKKMQKK